MSIAASLVVRVGADTGQFHQEFGKAEQRLHKFPAHVSPALAASDKLSGGFSRMGTALSTGLGVLGGNLATQAATKIGGLASSVLTAGFKFNSLQQQSQTAFTTIFQDADKAKRFMGELSAFAAKTPFELPGLTQAAARLTAVGVESQRVIPLMSALGDATSAMGTGAEGIDRAVTALTQMRQKGKVTGEEMLQLAEAGIPAWDALASKLGVDVATAQDRVSKGQVKVNDLFAALEERSGPAMQRLKGMMDQQSRSAAGLKSTLADTFAQVSGQLMAVPFDLATKGMQRLAEITSTPGFQEGVQRLSAGFGSVITAALDLGQRAVPVLVTAFGPLISFLVGQLPAAQALVSQGMDRIGQAFGMVAERVAPLIDKLGGSQELLSAVGIAVGGVLAAGFAALAVSAGAAAISVIAATLPFIAITAAAVALGVGIVQLVRHWDEITAKFPLLGRAADAVAGVAVAAWDRIRSGAAALIEWLPGAWERAQERIGKAWDGLGPAAAAAWAAVQKAAQPTIDFFREEWPNIQRAGVRVFHALQEAGQTALTALKTAVDVHVAVVKGLWTQFGDDLLALARSRWATIQGVVEGVLTVLRGVITTVTALINGDWSRAWDGAKTIVEGAVKVVTSLVSGMVREIGIIVRGVGEAIGDLSKILLNAGRAVIAGFLDGMKEAWRDAAGWLGDRAGEIKRLKGPIEEDEQMLQPEGEATIGGYLIGMMRRWGHVRQWFTSVAVPEIEKLGAELSEAATAQTTAVASASIASLLGSGSNTALRALRRDLADVKRAIAETKLALAELTDQRGAEAQRLGEDIKILAAWKEQLEQQITVHKEAAAAVTESRTAVEGFLAALAESSRQEGLIAQFGELGSTAAEALLTALEENTGEAGERAQEALQKLIRHACEQHVPAWQELGSAAVAAYQEALTTGTPEAVAAAQAALGQIASALKAQQTLTLEGFAAAFNTAQLERTLSAAMGGVAHRVWEAFGAAQKGGSARNVTALAEAADTLMATLQSKLPPEAFERHGAALLTALQEAIQSGTPEAVAALQSTLTQVGGLAASIPESFEQAGPRLQSAIRTLVGMVEAGKLPVAEAAKAMGAAARAIPEGVGEAERLTWTLIESIISAFAAGELSTDQFIARLSGAAAEAKKLADQMAQAVQSIGGPPESSSSHRSEATGISQSITRNYRNVEDLVLSVVQDEAGSFSSISVPSWLLDAYGGNLAALLSDLERGLLKDRAKPRKAANGLMALSGGSPALAFANGAAIVNGPVHAIIGEAGDEAVLPLERPARFWEIMATLARMDKIPEIPGAMLSRFGMKMANGGIIQGGMRQVLLGEQAGYPGAKYIVPGGGAPMLPAAGPSGGAGAASAGLPAFEGFAVAQAAQVFDEFPAAAPAPGTGYGLPGGAGSVPAAPPTPGEGVSNAFDLALEGRLAAATSPRFAYAPSPSSGGMAASSHSNTGDAGKPPVAQGEHVTINNLNVYATQPNLTARDLVRMTGRHLASRLQRM